MNTEILERDTRLALGTAFFNSVLQVGALMRKLTGTGKQKIQILRDFDGLVRSGEMLVVLGRPGSGCFRICLAEIPW
jgi:predicted ABC-type transport system involved in lysophospholipase L1 biosynthesis ATPase subunit